MKAALVRGLRFPANYGAVLNLLSPGSFPIRPVGASINFVDKQGTELMPERGKRPQVCPSCNLWVKQRRWNVREFSFLEAHEVLQKTFGPLE